MNECNKETLDYKKLWLPVVMLSGESGLFGISQAAKQRYIINIYPRTYDIVAVLTAFLTKRSPKKAT